MKTLGDVIKIETGEQLNKSDMLPDAEHPVVNGGIDFSGYTDKYNSEANTITISQGGASAGYVNWLNQKFWAGAHCYVVTPLPNNDERFLYHFIKSREYNFMKNQQGAGIPSLNRSEVYKIEFPDYDYSKQKKIAEILDSFTSLITNLETELASRQKQYEYYRNKLLTFEENDESVEWKTLREVCIKTSNIKWQKESASTEYLYIDLSSVTLDSHLIEETSTIDKSNAPSRAQQIVKVNDVLLGTTRPTLKRYCMIPESYDNQICSTGFCVFRPNPELVSSKWIYYNLSHQRFWDYCEQYQKGAGYPALANSDAFAFEIPFPSLERQLDIISVLDTFESLISNIKQELDARKKQYEYYREKLLTFE